MTKRPIMYACACPDGPEFVSVQSTHDRIPQQNKGMAITSTIIVKTIFLKSLVSLAKICSWHFQSWPCTKEGEDRNETMDKVLRLFGRERWDTLCNLLMDIILLIITSPSHNLKIYFYVGSLGKSFLDPFLNVQNKLSSFICYYGFHSAVSS